MEISKTPRRRGRPRGFDLDEVTSRAALLFWERGYEGVSVDELTAAMGITTQSFYAAFGSKQKLHREALAWYERELMRPVRDALAGEHDVARAIQRAMEACAREFTRLDRPLGCMRSTAGLCASRENEAVARHASGLRLETTAFLKARLDQGVTDGQLDAGTNTGALAVYLNAVVVGMAVAAQDGAKTSDLLAVAGVAGAIFRRTGQDRSRSFKAQPVTGRERSVRLLVVGTE